MKVPSAETPGKSAIKTARNPIGWLRRASRRSNERLDLGMALGEKENRARTLAASRCGVLTALDSPASGFRVFLRQRVPGPLDDVFNVRRPVFHQESVSAVSRSVAVACEN